MRIEASITGPDAAIAGFREASNQVRRGALREAFNKGARPIRKEARVLVPKDERHLERAIAISMSAKDTSVRADVGYKRRSKGGAARYGHLVEKGTAHSAAQPHLRPALDNRGREAVRVIAGDLGPALERVAARTRKRAAREAAKKAGA